MKIGSKGLSALGKLATLAIMAAAFIFGLAGVVYMSLQGEEIKVPEIVGKDFVESEKELAHLGLKIKRRADRFSPDPPNTVLEQLPKPGETVKTGQLILVVTSKSGGEGDQLPSTLKKSVEEDDTEKIEEMISEKPKKPKTNTNTNKKKAETTRDVTANSASATNSEKAPESDKKPANSAVEPLDRTPKVITIPSANRSTGTPANRPAATRPPNN